MDYMPAYGCDLAYHSALPYTGVRRCVHLTLPAQFYAYRFCRGTPLPPLWVLDARINGPRSSGSGPTCRRCGGLTFLDVIAVVLTPHMQPSSARTLLYTDTHHTVHCTTTPH